MEDELQVYPHDVEAERAVLGNVLVDYHNCKGTFDMLSDQDFYFHSVLFRILRRLHEKGTPPEYLTIQERAKDEKLRLEIIALVDAVSTTANWRHHVNIVKELSLRRQTIALAKELEAGAFDTGTDFKDFLITQRSRLEGVEKRFAIPVGDPWKHLDSYLEYLASLGKVPPRYRTGISRVDEVIQGGILPGQGIGIVGAQGSMKTALALHGVLDYIQTHKRKVVYLLLDPGMDNYEITMRLLQMELNQSEAEVLGFQMLHPEEYHSVAQRINNRLCGLLEIYKGPMDLKQVESLIRRTKPGVAVVDYVTAVSGFRNENECAISVYSRLGDLAKELGYANVFLAQMGRESKLAQSQGKFGNNAKGSGKAEEAVHVELELFNERKPEEEENDIQKYLDGVFLTFTKNRKGKSGHTLFLEVKFPGMKFTGNVREDVKHVKPRTKVLVRPTNFGQLGSRL